VTEHFPGSKIAVQLLTRSEGATMAEIIEATGGPQYNVLKRLEGRGYRVRKVKEGNTTRYFAEPPASESFEASVTSNGQVTIPKEIRERLRIRAGGKVRFTVEEADRVVMEAAGHRLGDLFGMLGVPPRRMSVEDMDEAIRRAAVERHLRSKA
jgi:antitoxin PrlF